MKIILLLRYLINIMNKFAWFPYKKIIKKNSQESKLKFSKKDFLYCQSIIFLQLGLLPYVCVSLIRKFSEIESEFGNTLMFVVILLNFLIPLTFITFSLYSLVNSKKMARLLNIINKKFLLEKLEITRRDFCFLSVMTLLFFLWSISNLILVISNRRNNHIPFIITNIISYYLDFVYLLYTFLFYILSMIMKTSWKLGLEKISFEILHKLMKVTSHEHYKTSKDNPMRSTYKVKFFEILKMSRNQKNENFKIEASFGEINTSLYEKNYLHLKILDCLQFASERAIELNRLQSLINGVFLFPISFIILNKITWICIQFFILLTIIMYNIFNNFAIYCILIVFFYSSSIFIICESSRNAEKQV